jgi:uncharacterized protein (DUF1778 family)
MAAPRRTSERSDVYLTVRVSPQERQRIEKAAKARGLTTSAYVRGTALRSSSRTASSTNRSRGAASP